MLEHYHEFAVLARHLNFSTAALELNVSQPSLSRHIAELEREVGFKLLERKPVALTPAGRVFLEQAEQAFDLLESAIERGRAVACGGRNYVVTSTTPGATVATDIFYAALATLRIETPDSSLRMALDKTRDVLDLVMRGEADVGMVPYAPASLPEGFRCERLLDYVLDVWTHADSPLLACRPLRFEDLAPYHLVASTCRIFDAWLEVQKEVFRRKGMKPKVRLKALESLNDFALSIKPDEIMIADRYNKDPSAHINPALVQLHLDDPVLVVQCCLVYRENSEEPLVERFVSACRDVAAKQVVVMRKSEEMWQRMRAEAEAAGTSGTSGTPGTP